MTEESHGDCGEQESPYSSQETSGAVPAEHKDQPQISPAVRQSYSLKGSMHGPSPAKHAEGVASMVSQSGLVLSEEKFEAV